MAGKVHVTLRLLKAALLVLLLLHPRGAFGGGAEGKTRKANELFGREKYAEALKLYQEAQTQKPDSPELHYDLAAALYKSGKLQEAEEELQSSLRSAPDELKSRVLFNLGNCMMKEAQDKPDPSLLKAAAEFYKESLKLEPDDLDAKFNLELALKELEEQKKQENKREQQKSDRNEKNSDNKKQQEQSRKDEEKDRSNRNKEGSKQQRQQKEQTRQAASDSTRASGAEPLRLSKQDVEKILNALKQQEKEARAELRKAKTRPGSTHEKDW